MAIKDLVRMNGNTTNLPARREEETSLTPYRDLDSWTGQWDQWLNSMWNRMLSASPFGSEVLNRWGQGSNLSTLNSLGSYVPAVNVTETENEYKVTAELPGIEPDEVELTFNRGTLTIRGEKKHEHEENERGYYRMERSYGQFHRSLQLPEGVDGDKIEANFKNGLLTVTVPKLAELKQSAKRIQIKSENK